MTNRIAQTSEVRSVNREERTIDVVVSTFAGDSYGTRFDPNGWDLEQFRRNPVITWAHDDRGYTPSGGRPIAKGENVRVEDGKLKMRLRFPTAGKFVFADECFELMADGFLNATSVGFDPIEWKDEQVEGGMLRTFTKQKLVEVGVVTIPSNDEALAERAKAMNADLTDVRGRIERLERMAAQPSPEDVEKWRKYYANKQPANRASTGVLERFFKSRGEKQPDNEVAAWKRMAELLGVPAAEEKPAGAEPETAPEPLAAEPAPEAAPEVKPEEPQPEPKPEEPKEEPEPTPPPPAEAPQAPPEEAPPARSYPLSALKALPQALIDASLRAARESAERGEPVTDPNVLVEQVGSKLFASLSNR
jgi:HK97 family phage prohead protease